MVDYTDVMDVRRATYWAAIRLAVVFSTVATVVALGLDTVGDVSPTVLVLTVIVVGFTISWRRTGHVASQRVAAQTAHRIARVPIRTAPVRTHLA
jgi:hypothetical protein